MGRLIAGAILVLLAATTTSAFAEERVARLASGIEGGTYHDLYAKRINERVDGWRFENRATRGSTDNLDLLATGKVDVALAQADVHASRILEEPDVFGELVVLGDVAEECIFVARKKTGPLTNFGAIGSPVGSPAGDRPARINLGPQQTGMAESWNYICSLMPEHAIADIDHSDGPAAFEKLAAGRIDAVAWVTAPTNPDHKLLKIARDDPRFDFISVDDKRLGGKLWDGRTVYKIRHIPIPGSGAARSIETACTSTLLLARPDADPAMVAAIRAALAARKNARKR